LLGTIKKAVRSVITIVKYSGSRISFFSNVDSLTTLGSNNYIGRNTSLHKCRLGNNVSVHNHVSINNSALGDYVKIHSNNMIINCQIGRLSYLASNTLINQATIGAFCSIGPNVKIGSGEHPTNFISTSPLFYSRGGQLDLVFAEETMFDEVARVEIGNDVHIGANVYIKNGIKIGDGVIIGAGSIVVKDVEDYTIIGGVPGKLIRKRFSEDIIEVMRDIKWWNYDISILKDKVEFFQKPVSLEAIIKLGKELKSSDRVLSKAEVL